MDPEPVMMGQGPFIFDYWETALEWSIYKFDDYWDGWPAKHPIMGTTARGYVERATVKFIDEWPTRKLMFLAGDLDLCYVPRMYMDDVWAQPGLTCIYPLATLICSGFFFNFDIASTSRYLRAPFTSYECAAGELNEGGFPPDIFTDIHVRRGFAYAMDYVEFLAIAFLGEAVYPATPAIFGLPYRQSDEWYAEHQYMLDLAKAEEEFKLAFGGDLWETGFTLTICYNIGNLPRKTIAEMLASNVEMLNPKFHVDTLEVEWGTVYIPELFNGELTLFIIGWLADYPDPHNFFHPFMHTYGAFADWQGYSNPVADALIEEGGTCVDPVRRQEIYYELQELFIDECPSVQTHQATGRHWERDWVQGWYYNPIYSGTFFYHLWKEDLPAEDINMDGAINIRDITDVALAFGSYYAIGETHPRWNAYADINFDERVDIRDITFVAMQFGYVAPPWT
jgi:peptide/nickel transport system substrate-binding protein